MEPLSTVLESANFVAKSAQDVSIPENGIENLAKIVRPFYESLSASYCVYMRSMAPILRTVTYS